MAITKAYAGPLPSNRQSRRKDAMAGFEWRAGVSDGAAAGKRKAGVTGNRSAGYGPHATGGWVRVEPGDWSGKPEKPEMVEIRLYNGRKSYVPVGDVNEFMQFHAIPTNQIAEELAKEANDAFSIESGRGRYYTSKGTDTGHITGLRYNPSKQVMEVTFQDGTTVVFFRLPNVIYIELDRHFATGAKSLGFDGSQRHLVGIRFWDLVRIRGSRYGARYPFTYGAGGSLTAGANAIYSDGAWDAGRVESNAADTVAAFKEATVESMQPVSEAPTETDKKQDIDDDIARTLKKFRENAKAGAMPIGQRNAFESGLEKMRDKPQRDYQAYKQALERGDTNLLYTLSAKYKLWG